MIEVGTTKSNKQMDAQFIKEAGEIKSSADLERFAEDWGMTVEEVLADPLFGDLPNAAKQVQGRGLLGNRDKDGNLKVATYASNKTTPISNTKKEGEIMFTHANGSSAFAEPGSDMADELMAQEYFPGAIAAKNAGKQQSNTGSDWTNTAVVEGHPELAELIDEGGADDEYDYYGNRRAVTKTMNDPDGFLQRQMRKRSTSGKTEQFDQDDTGRIIKTESKGLDTTENKNRPEYKNREPETMGNQFGYHKREGQNFWTVNNDDPYWDNHEMGTGDAWSDADLKEEPLQELDIDFSSWFK
jgi:hypothetical protein